jgi:hypothetical protein
VLGDIEDAVGALLRSVLPGGTGVVFEPPSPEWTDGTVSMFLHRIVEDVDARAASWADEVDAHGRVTARLPPPRRYRFCYLLTAWAQDRRTEQALISTVLGAMAGLLRVPSEHIPPAISDRGATVDLDVAHPGLPGAGPELWHALGIAPRTCLDLVVTSTLAPAATTPLPDAPREVVLGTRRSVPEPPGPVVAVPPPARRIQED